ncbi:MAG: hypothetical protein LBB23_01315 [Rickettsiales bacterium]|nr:hypothetical protein [Rickettsiales bacterium]
MKKVFALIGIMALAACAGNNQEDPTYDNWDNPQFIGSVPGSSSDTGVITPDSNIAALIEAKWSGNKIDTRYEEYRGRVVRVQVLLNDSDLHEMRLRLMPATDGAHSGGKTADILERVAEFSSKRVCGKGVLQVNIVYDQPSFDSIKPSPYYDHKVDDRAVNIREYGFTCAY